MHVLGEVGTAEAFLPPDLDSSGIDIGQSYLIVSIRECRVSTCFNKAHLDFLNFEQKPIVLLSKPTKGFGNNNNLLTSALSTMQTFPTLLRCCSTGCDRRL